MGRRSGESLAFFLAKPFMAMYAPHQTFTKIMKMPVAGDDGFIGAGLFSQGGMRVCKRDLKSRRQKLGKQK
jgi:hypothetical protein